jgi:hypothetical protein
MRTLRFTSLLALLLMVFAAAQTTRAAAAAGSYQFTMAGEKELKYVEFSAEGDGTGKATGSIYFSDEAVYTIQDVDGTGEKEGKIPGYTIKADVDGLVVTENKAILSATITSSSNDEFIGQRVLFTVIDNGDNTKLPDGVTWGIYREIRRDWVPSDAEWKEDPGVGLRWWATDFERKGDVGYQMPRDESIGANTNPLSSYIYADIDNAAGDIRVSP